MPQTNIVRQDGVRGVLMSIFKLGGASTLTVVDGIKAMVPIAAQSLPRELNCEGAL
jgi:multidrug efflux pump subunit AcrB